MSRKKTFTSKKKAEVRAELEATAQGVLIGISETDAKKIRDTQKRLEGSTLAEKVEARRAEVWGPNPERRG